MGLYIQTKNNHKKAQEISSTYNGEIISKPNSFSDIPKNKSLIVVIDNLIFEAAGYAFNEGEFEALSTLTDKDQRHRDYVLVDKSVTENIFGE